jgi:hypothetical protein
MQTLTARYETMASPVGTAVEAAEVLEKGWMR